MRRMRTTKEYIVHVETSEVEKVRHQLNETERNWRPQLEPALKRWRTAAVELENLLAEEKKSLEAERETLTVMQNRLEARFEEIETLTHLVPSYIEAPKIIADSAIQRKLDVSTRELATLSRMLRTAEDNARWSSDVNKILLLIPTWWRFMPKRWQQRKLATRLRQQGLFNTDVYLERYPDVAQAKMDPLRHYVWHGQAEGRLR